MYHSFSIIGSQKALEEVEYSACSITLHNMFRYFPNNVTVKGSWVKEIFLSRKSLRLMFVIQAYPLQS